MVNSIPNSKEVYVYIQEQRIAAGPATAPGATFAGANGMIHAYAGGGFASGIYAGRSGAIHKFAEPETRWEAYISGKPGQEERNRGIALEALERLGGFGGASPQSTGGAGGGGAVALSSMDRTLLREIRDRVGIDVPTGTLQGAFSSSNVGTSTRGRA
jgi:hypothetical protein